MSIYMECEKIKLRVTGYYKRNDDIFVTYKDCIGCEYITNGIYKWLATDKRVKKLTKIEFLSIEEINNICKKFEKYYPYNYLIF